MGKKIITGIFLCLFLSSFPGAAQQINLKPLVSVDEESAETGGRVQIKPTLSSSARLDSNYYKSQKDERQVYTYVVQPGIQIGYKTSKSSAGLKYTLDTHFYNDGDDVPKGEISADEHDFIGHTVDFFANTTPVSKLTLELAEQFRKTRDQSESDRFALDERKDKYAINRITPGVSYRINERFSTGAKYRNTISSYDGTVEQDYVENRGIFDLFYHLSPTAFLDLAYERWKRSYDAEVSDYVSDQVELSLKKEAKYMGFEAGAGYHHRDFDDRTRDDRDTFSYRLAVTGQKARTHGRFSFEDNFNDEGISGSFYRARKFTLSAGQTFMEKFSTDIEGYYRLSDYEEMDREDDTFGISAALGYKFKDWLSFKLAGGYDNRNSNMDINDYDNTYFMIRFDSAYDSAR